MQPAISASTAERSPNGASGAGWPTTIHSLACGDRAVLAPSGWKVSSGAGRSTDGEIQSVWQAAGGLGSFGGLVQFALLTAMRRGELSGLRWSDIKYDRIVLEAQHTKTGSAHEVPLTDLMREVLARQPRTSAKFVFPSSRTSTRISGWTKLVNRLVNDQRRRPHHARHTTDMPHVDVAPRRA